MTTRVKITPFLKLEGNDVEWIRPNRHVHPVRLRRRTCGESLSVVGQLGKCFASCITVVKVCAAGRQVEHCNVLIWLCEIVRSRQTSFGHWCGSRNSSADFCRHIIASASREPGSIDLDIQARGKVEESPPGSWTRLFVSILLHKHKWQDLASFHFLENTGIIVWTFSKSLKKLDELRRRCVPVHAKASIDRLPDAFDFSTFSFMVELVHRLSPFPILVSEDNCVGHLYVVFASRSI